jgi:hypothetical protein
MMVAAVLASSTRPRSARLTPKRQRRAARAGRYILYVSSIAVTAAASEPLTPTFTIR